MDEPIIIDEPWNAGQNVAVATRWLAELDDLAADGFQVAGYIKRGKELLAQAKKLEPLGP